MCKTSKIIIFVFFFVIQFSGVALGADITSINDLIENSKSLDEKEVTLQGEAIGDLMLRGDYAWVNINDGTNAIGIWMKAEDAKKISFFGDYKHKGDIIKVTGVFDRDCDEHGGDVDIHSFDINIIQKGYLLKENINPVKSVFTLILFAFAIVAVLLYFRIMRRPSYNE